jgi:hypothetical protein
LQLLTLWQQLAQLIIIAIPTGRKDVRSLAPRLFAHYVCALLLMLFKR